ncbi:MAG: nitronate monooxygenase [Nostocoides sp.]
MTVAPQAHSDELPASHRTHPVLIQGGMGVAVSGWRLAREVAQAGHLGVVSGTAMDSVLARTLQDGDPGGHYGRAIAHFPDPELAERVLSRYLVTGGRAQTSPYAPVPKLTVDASPAGQLMTVMGNFAEVWLAKEGHEGPVGINCLEKIQMATPAALLGAMLAGVDYVLMGAGIPREIPALLRSLAAGQPGQISIDVAGSSAPHQLEIDPADFMGGIEPPLKKPDFLAIVSLDQLASYLHRDPSIRPDGFVIERPNAGGHSAPPRGRMELDENGEPLYGARDEANLEKMAALGSPFWLAGAYGTPDGVTAALRAGAQGVQVGTIFALCRESGLPQATREDLLHHIENDTLTVRNDPRASPTGFPFKVAKLSGTGGDPAVYAQRSRLCDLSYLRQPFERADGTIGYRCAAEPTHMYLRKGGALEDTLDRVCLCNGLMATVGLGQQRRDGYTEPPLVTLGSDLAGARELLGRHPQGWSALDALRYLQEGLSTSTGHVPVLASDATA